MPLSFEKIEQLIGQWAKHPHVTVHVLGKSLGGRNIYRLEITDPESPHPRASRWVHWFGNQHPGEHNSQWRIAGMIDWLLSEQGDDARRRSICHFVPITSPDGPSNGWYRVNAQGVDMNRSYFSGGADQQRQAHEAYIVQRDLEKLMATDSPVTSLWSMHTWGGPVEPILVPGPEVGSTLGPWEEFKEVLIKNDPQAARRTAQDPRQTARSQGDLERRSRTSSSASPMCCAKAPATGRPKPTAWKPAPC